MFSTDEIHGTSSTRPTLVVDVGNSDSVFGLFLPDEIVKVVRVPSVRLAPEPEAVPKEFLEGFLGHLQDIPTERKRILVSSVVPRITPGLVSALEGLFQVPVVILGPKLYESLPVTIPLPEEIGSDLVANAIQAAAHTSDSCIIVDFGTALTYTAIDNTGAIRGVAIAPGIRTAMMALSSGTAQLPEIELKIPDSALGQNTIDAIRSGILFGYTGMVKEVLLRMKSELPAPCYVIATGGLVGLLSTLESEFDKIDPFLTLKGLKRIADGLK